MGLWDYFSSDSIITDISALKSAIDTTTKNLEKAKYLPYFTTKFSDVYTKFTQAEKKLKSISGVLGKVEKVKSLADSEKKIRWALSVLKEEHVLRFDSEKAAIAIGVLLVEVGELSKNLPTPASGYSQFLIALGGNFTKIVNDLIPQKRKTQKDQWDALGFSIGAN